MQFAIWRRSRVIFALTILVFGFITFQSNVSRAEESKSQQVAPPASETQPGIVTGALKGRAAILQHKNARPAKEYSGPSIKVEPAEPQVSAVWLGSGFPAIDPALAPIRRIDACLGWRLDRSLTVKTQVSYTYEQGPNPIGDSGGLPNKQGEYVFDLQLVFSF